MTKISIENSINYLCMLIGYGDIDCIERTKHVVQVILMEIKYNVA